MKISDIAKGGGKFKASIGPGSFNKKLYSATKHGDLNNLKDNRESIVKAVKVHERAIKLGKFDRIKRMNAWKIVKKNDPNLSKKDARDIKKLFLHLSEGKPEAVAPIKDIKMQKALDKDDSYFIQKKAKAKKNADILNKIKQADIDPRLKARVSVVELNKPTKRDDRESGAEHLREKAVSREKMLKARMPSHRVHYDKERETRLEVSSFSRDLNKKYNPNADKEDEGNKKSETRGYEPFQNL